MHHFAAAQTTGNLEGRVLESAGQPLPGETLEATSAALQGVRGTVSMANGSFQFPGIPPGKYRIQARLEGFLPAEAEAVVPLDKTATVELAMKLAVTEAVSVSGAAPPIDFTSTTTGTNYEGELTQRLPVERNYADIIRANPGVTTDRGETQGRSLSLSIYGATSAENIWIIDGVDTTNVIKGTQGKAINSEFVDEVQVKTGGYQAEYGGALGGIINVVTKSGGNEFHGDGFVYYDESDWQATRVVPSGAVQTGMRVSDYKKTDFGVDLGGALLKDRLWFFGAANRVDQPAHVSRYDDTALVSSSQKFPLDATDSLYSGKLTWRAGPGTTLVLTAFSDPTTNSGAGAADPRQGGFVVQEITNPDPATWESTRHIGGTDASARVEQLFGAAAYATLQAARHNDRYELLPTGPADAVRFEDFTCAGGTPDAPCQRPPGPNFVTGGFGFNGGGASNRNRSTRDHLRGDVNFFLGSHELKSGGDWQRETTTSVNAFSGGQLVQRLNETGVEYYEHQFFAKSRTDLTPSNNVSNPVTINVGAFLQDSYQPLPGLTVNAGLRWDGQDMRDYRGQPILKTGLWQPRFGIVWDPRRDGRTKLYASAGRFSYALPTDLSVRAFGDPNFAVTFNYDPIETAQDPTVPGHGRPVLPSGGSAERVDHGIEGGYQDELTIGVERLVAEGFTVGLKGTYRRLGRAIEDRCDLDSNQPENNFSQCGLMNPGSGAPIASGNVPVCNYLDDPYFECTPTGAAVPPARRVYRGLEVVARKHFGNRYWIQASYIYSSLRGNYDGAVRALDGQTDPGISFAYDYPQMYVNGYGRLSLDRPHSFRLDGTWTAPFGGFAGLQFFVQSGAPTDRLGYLNEFSPGAVFLVEQGTEGRMPTQWEGNLTLGYPLNLGPVTATLQLYVFNFFNNQIPLARDNAWSISPPPDYPNSLYNPHQEQNNSNYGKVISRQGPRQFRAAVRVSF